MVGQIAQILNARGIQNNVKNPLHKEDNMETFTKEDMRYINTVGILTIGLYRTLLQCDVTLFEKAFEQCFEEVSLGNPEDNIIRKRLESIKSQLQGA